jgi:thiamine-phosphate pyrophosphorylase
VRGAAAPPPIYAIADLALLGEARLLPAVEAMAEAGILWLQLRLKPVDSDAALLRLAEACARRLEGSGVRLWVDDRADLARLLGAAGLHVGQRDLPPAAARVVVGASCWIGRSTHDLEQVAAADADPEVNVVATSSKAQPDPVVGLEALRAARARTRKPLVAIGGIGLETLPAIWRAGADSAVLLSALCQGDAAANCRAAMHLATSFPLPGVPSGGPEAL